MPRLIASIPLFLAMTALAARPGTAFACTENNINCKWNLAVQATENLDLPAFARAVAGAHAALEASPAPTLSDRATVLRLDGIFAAMQGDNEAATQAFRAARLLDPTADFPGALYAPDHPIARLYAAAGPGAALVAVAPPASNIPVTSDMASALEAPSSRELRAPLLVGAAASGLLSGGLLALSRSVPEVEPLPGQAPMDYVHATSVAFAREQGLRTGAGGAALLGAGLLTAGLTVAW